MLSIGCSTKTEVIEKVQIKYIAVPQELLIIDKLNKPVVNEPKDIVNAYIDLFYYAKACVTRLKLIKEYNEDLNASTE